VDLSIFAVSKVDEVVPAINAAKAAGVEALNFLATPMFFQIRRTIIDSVTTVRLPAIYQWPEIAQDGGLAAYGAPLPQIYRQVARLVVKVFQGSKPADIPIEQPTKFALVINLKSAKALGLEIPPQLFARADEVIE
jgi:putative ABC transport system substrate-binding protein